MRRGEKPRWSGRPARGGHGSVCPEAIKNDQGGSFDSSRRGDWDDTDTFDPETDRVGGFDRYMNGVFHSGSPLDFANWVLFVAVFLGTALGLVKLRVMGDAPGDFEARLTDIISHAMAPIFIQSAVPFVFHTLLADAWEKNRAYFLPRFSLVKGAQDGFFLRAILVAILSGLPWGWFDEIGFLQGACLALALVFFNWSGWNGALHCLARSTQMITRDLALRMGRRPYYGSLACMAVAFILTVFFTVHPIGSYFPKPSTPPTGMEEALSQEAG